MTTPVTDAKFWLGTEGEKIAFSQSLVDEAGRAADEAFVSGEKWPTPIDDANASSKDDFNPKDRLGVKKPNLYAIPPAGLLHEAMAMNDGGMKYGFYNWRDKPVRASIYIAACQRHLLSFLDGEQYDPVSKCHHLGHARACLGILLDAIETGNVVNDLPEPGAAAAMIRHFEKAGTFDGR